VKNPEKPCDFR